MKKPTYKDYLRAAKRVHAGGTEYCCLVLKFYLRVSADDFVRVFAPKGAVPNNAFWPDEDRESRVTALLLMAEIAKAEAVERNGC